MIKILHDFSAIIILYNILSYFISYSYIDNHICLHLYIGVYYELSDTQST